MEQLPLELLRLIKAQITRADEAMLGLASKTLHKLLSLKNSVLDYCVYDGTMAQVKLCEEWGNTWTEKTYYWLGLGGNVELAEYRCITKLSGFCRFQKSRIAEEIYKGACYGGHSSLLEWIYANYRKRGCFDCRWDDCGPHFAAQGHRYHLLDGFIQSGARSLFSIFDTAGQFLDLELVKYCLKNNIVSTGFLGSVVQSKKSLAEVTSFLDNCKAEGVCFNELELPYSIPSLEWTLLFVSYGVKYINTRGELNTRKNLPLQSNVGKIDWNNSHQKRYLFYVISSKYKEKDWYRIRCMKSFMKAELDYGRPGVEDAYAEFLVLHQAEKQKALTLFHT